MAELLRKDQKVENTWDIESIFPTEEDFWKQFKEVEEFLPEIKNYKGKVTNGAKELLEVFKVSEKWGIKLEELYIYAFFRNDQDSTDSKNKEIYAKTGSLASKFGAEWSFLVPELLSVDEEVLNGYIEELDEFISTNKIPYKYFYKAFGYWILCSLQRCKENKNRYGILTRKLINFSKKLWKKVRSLSERIAKEIKQFQKEPDASRLY